MKKNITTPKNAKGATTARKRESFTIGMDLGDKASRFCVLNKAGDIVRESSVGDHAPSSGGPAEEPSNGRRRPDTAETRLLHFLVEQRRQTVDERTRQSNRLTDCLKQFSPRFCGGSMM